MTQALSFPNSRGCRATVLTIHDHTERLQRIDGRLDRIEDYVKGLRRDMPNIVADALRATRIRRPD